MNNTTGQKIYEVYFKPSIYPKYVKTGEPYPPNHEIILEIRESGDLIQIYTAGCGVNYGTPIVIPKKDVESIDY